MPTEKDKIIEKFREKGYRITQQRLTILDVLRNSKAHPTADEIYSIVQAEIPDISLGTVYRTLNTLEELGLIRKFCCGKSCCRYDGNIDIHYHAICLGCNKVFDIDGPLLDSWEEKFSKETGFLVTEHKLQLYGYCKDCKSIADFRSRISD